MVLKKNRIIPFLAVAYCLGLNSVSIAQGVGINVAGTSPDASAVLDVSATDKGMLVPRIALTGTNDVATILTPATSLLVYNTATVSDVTPGFYYFDGSLWTRVGTGSGSDDQNINGSGLAGTTLTIGIENGTSETVDLASLKDHDWYEVGGTTSPDAITDDIFTQGDVGVGLTVPQSKFHIHGGSMGTTITRDLTIERYGNSGTGRGVGIEFKTGTSGTNTQVSGAIEVSRYNTGDGTMMSFFTTDDSGVENSNMVISDVGYVGIGTTTPVNALHVFGGAAPIRAERDGVDSWYWGINATRMNFTNVTTGTAPITLERTGLVGIANPNPTEELDIIGTVKIVDGTQGAGRVLTSDANGVASWVEVSNNALTTPDETSGSFPQANGGTIYSAGGNYDLGTMNVTPGVYMWFLYNCAGQCSYTTGSGTTISIVGGTATVTSTSTWANLASQPSGSCGTIYTGVLKVTAGGTVSARFQSYLGSVLVKNSAMAANVRLVKIN